MFWRRRRSYSGNGEIMPNLVFGVDDQSIDLQDRLVRLTNPASPQCQGTAETYHQGDRGYGSNKSDVYLPYAVQDFRGAAVPVSNPETAQLGYGLSGVAAAGSLPYTTLPGIDGSLATMSGVA